MDEEIESLIQQERALFLIDADHNHIRREHKQLVAKLTQLQTELTNWMAEFANQDSRIARTIEFESILESQGGKLLEFSEDLYTGIIEKIVVEERTKFEFHL
ncbi:MAG: hypothetical protein P4L69_20900 [Desulfosporosinus sp.]|nr:hypothetical protein [Desulfosporosinus sp.]